MTYFTLLPIAKFEYDKFGGSIINLLDFSRIHYNEEEKDFLLGVLNCNIENIEEYNSEEQKIILELLDKGFAYLYNNPVFNEHHRDNREAEIRGLVEEVPHFSKIYIEITEECDRKCEFCESNLLIEKACDTCIRWKKKRKSGEIIFDYGKMIQRIAGLWVDEIVISGGNPLLAKEKLMDYITKIREAMEEVKISVYTNGEGLDKQLMHLFTEYDVSVKFVLLDFSVGGNLGEVKENIYRNIRECVETNVECSVILLGKEALMQKKEKIQMELECTVDLEVPIDKEICDKNKFSERRKRVTKRYWKNQKYSSCLNNKLAISLDGLIRPCPMIDDTLIDLKNEKFDELFQKMIIDKYWRFTKNNVKMCHDCPYKYSCEDCTALELEINKGMVSYKRLCDRI